MMKKIKRINKLKIAIVTIAILMLMTFLFFSYFIISRDISLPYSLWIKGVSRAEYKKHSYVMTKINDPLIARYDYIIKKISCISGERLVIKEDAVSRSKKIFCNDNYIGEILAKDRNGNELEAFTTYDEIVIPPRYYFLSGTHKRSYDSRYFGLISDTDIMLDVYPIL